MKRNPIVRQWLAFGIILLFVGTAVPTVESVTMNTINPIVPSSHLSSGVANSSEKVTLLHQGVMGIDYFEYTVSLDGDTAVIGASRGDVPSFPLWAGSVYVFIRSNNIWRQQQRIFTPNDLDGYSFGWSVSVSDDTILIGAPTYAYEVSPGYTYVYTRSGTRWAQQAKLSASDATDWDMFGLSVSLDGDTALIGAPSDDDNGNFSGSAYVFTRSGTTWTQQAKLLPSDGTTCDLFGASVTLDGDTALIGAPGDGFTSVSSGCAYVFTRSGNIWTQKAKIIASDCIRKDQFGISVSLERDTALVGAQQRASNWGTGCAYIYTRSGNTWTQQAKLLASDGNIGDSFGYSVAISGDTALIGAYSDKTENYRGSAYVFTRSGTTWQQQQKLQVAGKFGDYFGISVALEGDTALISAFYSGEQETYGSVYIFTYTGSIWIQQTRLLDIKESTNENTQLPHRAILPISMNTPFYQIMEKVFERFPNAFPLLQQFFGY